MENLMKQTQIITTVAIVIFAFVMLAIGLSGRRHAKNIEGFLLGGRKIGPWVSAFSYGTAYFSAVIFVGYAGKHGWNIGVGSIWIGVGNAVLGCLLAWLLLAKPTRNLTRKLGAKTMPEFFEKRYNSTGLKVLSAIIIFVFLVPYSAAVYTGLGNMFHAIFPNVSTTVWMCLIACLTAAYLVLGGYMAAAYTDFVQGIIMIFGVVAMIVAIALNPNVGGFADGFRRLSALTDETGEVGKQLTSVFGGSSFNFLAVNILLTSFGTWGLPQMVSKYYAIKDDKAIKTATVVSTVFAGIIGCGAYYVGSMSRLVLSNKLPEGGLDFVIPDTLMTALATNRVTIVILAIVLLLLLSASMSTLSSIVLSSASAISVDVASMIKKNYKTEQQMIFTRLMCFLFVGLSLFFALMKIGVIVNLMSFSWGVVAGSFIGTYMWGVLWDKTTKAAAYSGMIGGLLTVGIPCVVYTASGGFANAVAHAPELGVAAMAVSVVIVPVVTLFTKKR